MYAFYARLDQHSITILSVLKLIKGPNTLLNDRFNHLCSYLAPVLMN